MSRFDYRPRQGGAEYDPVDVGGQVTSMTLFTTADRSGDPAGVVAMPTRPRPGVYRFEIPDTQLPPGRYWCSVTYTPAENQPAVTDASVRLDLPLGTGLVVSPEAVGKQLGVALPLTADQREDFLDEIQRAQSDVHAYLARPLVPSLVQLTKVLPAFETDPGDWRAWRDLEGTPDDEYQVDAYSPNPDGTYNVTLRVGLDGAAEEPIARFVAAHAAETLRLSDRYGKRRVTSVSAEGQSVSYEASPSASQNRSSQKAGELPDITTLSRYKEVPVFVRQKFRRGPWPYGPSHLSGW